MHQPHKLNKEVQFRISAGEVGTKHIQLCRSGQLSIKVVTQRSPFYSCSKEEKLSKKAFKCCKVGDFKIGNYN